MRSRTSRGSEWIVRAAGRWQGVWIVAASCMLMSYAVPAEAYWGTEGSLYALSGFGNTEDVNYAPDDRAFFLRTVSAVSTYAGYESSATSTAGASLMLGSLWARTASDFDSTYGWSDARAAAALYDFIQVDIPAGTYPAGVYLTVNGSFTGAIALQGDISTTADVHWEVVLDFGSWDYDRYFDRIQRTASGSYTVNSSHSESIDEPFSVSVEIYPPGYTAPADGSFDVRFRMSMGKPEAVGLTPVWSQSWEGDVTDPTPGGSSSIDMMSTGQITSIEVSGDGTSWDSESGVLFVPEPGQLGGMLSGVALLGALAWRRGRGSIGSGTNG